MFTPRNRGYGGNQKTCYCAALEAGADIVVMLHPDYQYSPSLVEPMASMIAFGVYDIVLGSRILGGGALRGGMPRHKYVANRMLTLVQNLALGAKLSEYHTGFRAYSRDLLMSLPLEANSDDFVFDNQLLAQCIYLGARIGEVSCPTRYFPEASSINFRRSTIYGLGVLKTTADCVAARLGSTASRSLTFPPLQLKPQTVSPSQPHSRRFDERDPGWETAHPAFGNSDSGGTGHSRLSPRRRRRGNLCPGG